MATISLQCNNHSQTHSSVYFRLKIVRQVEQHGRSAKPSLAEIHHEMRELLDKQVNAQKESLKKYFCYSCKLSQAHKNAIKMKETKK